MAEEGIFVNNYDKLLQSNVLKDDKGNDKQTPNNQKQQSQPGQQQRMGQQPMMPGQPGQQQGQPMMYGQQQFGRPMQGQPMQGQPMQGHPMQGQPMQGQPMQGQPMQGQPMQMQGQPMGGQMMKPGQPTGGGTGQQMQLKGPRRQRYDPNNPPAGYKDPKYPRDLLPENREKEMDLGGAYQSYLYCLGDCLGSLRAFIPCIFCVDYPYVTVEQSYVGMYHRFGKYVKATQPGYIYVNPCTDSLRVLDMKTQLIDCPRQAVLTKDNILVSIDATVQFRICIARKAFYYLQDIRNAVNQVTLATIKSVAGSHILQDLLEKREQVTFEIQSFVDAHVWEWGIDIETLMMKDIQINPELQETLSMATKEKRSAQAKVISAKANVESAKLMKQAADFLDSKAAMQIRYLETIQILGKQNSTKVVFTPQDKEK